MNSDKNSSSSSPLPSVASLSAPTRLQGKDDTTAEIERVEPEELAQIAAAIHSIAERDRDDCLALLHLLRTLEQLHREIQQEYFQPALPDSRHALYTLLRDIEENGGWPYIHRWKLQSLFANLPAPDK